MKEESLRYSSITLLNKTKYLFLYDVFSVVQKHVDHKKQNAYSFFGVGSTDNELRICQFFPNIIKMIEIHKEIQNSSRQTTHNFNNNNIVLECGIVCNNKK